MSNDADGAVEDGFFVRIHASVAVDEVEVEGRECFSFVSWVSTRGRVGEGKGASVGSSRNS